jgi:hypothetical protein
MAEQSPVITVAQAQEKMRLGREGLGAIIRIAAKGRTSFAWHEKARVYVVLTNKKVTHRGAILADAVAAYNTAVTR